jgi:hypothetical protein
LQVESLSKGLRCLDLRQDGFLFAGIDQDAVAVGDPGLCRLSRLAPVVEGHRAAPYVLIPIALLLAVVLP